MGSGVVRVYKTKAFRRFQRKERIEDTALGEAVRRAERGLIDADLGAGLIKQRVARKGQGRRSGFRTIIAYRTEVRSVFMYGFAKSGQANLSTADERDLADFGRMLLSLKANGIETLIIDNELEEIEFDDEA